MKEVVVAGVCRTPVGSYGGTLKDVGTAELGSIVMAEALKRSGVKADQLDEVIFGCVLQGGLGQNVTRQAAIKAGIPDTVTCFTINKVCGSGVKSVALAAQAIKAGDADIILAGGMESMSGAPYISDKARWGARMGDTKLVDMMIKDGLWEAFNNMHMGMTAEEINVRKNQTREEQDVFALRSQERALAAIAAGKFKDEIVPVVIKSKKGDKVFDTDEFPKQTSADKLAAMKPAFKKDGSVTAGNASGINDGAAAMVVMSKEKADELGIKPMARIVSYASGGLDPIIMGMGPVPASTKALKIAGLTVDDLSLIEANEAFAAQSVAVAKEMGWADKTDIVNVNGGAIAIGHPIGGSGTRIMTTLLYEMEKRDLKGKYGLATLCIGGGMGIAMIFEKL